MDIPDDLPVLEPSVTITLPLNEQITSAVIVPDELSGGEGSDVLYVAVSQERVNVWAAAVYFVPELVLGVTGILILVALRKWWVGRRFLHRKGEHYCKKCWAGLTGVESATCPECGRPVEKTKRVAKRSRRSPLSPRWAWPAAALLAILGCAAIWFGEGWHTAWRSGMDPRDEYTRRQLYNYANRDSVFRINPMAGWFDWRSTKLAALARERDQAWIDVLGDRYETDALVAHVLIRRYDLFDGSLLGEDDLPAASRDQDIFVRIADCRLGVAAGRVFAIDGDGYLYHLCHGHDESWVEFDKRQDDERIDTAYVTPDGEHIMMVLNQPGGGLFAEPSEDLKRIVVFDLDTGSVVATLEFDTTNFADIPPSDGDAITAIDTAVSAASAMSIKAVLHDIVLVEDEGQALLMLEQSPALDSRLESMAFVLWDFVSGDLEPVFLDLFLPETLRYDLGPRAYNNDWDSQSLARLHFSMWEEDSILEHLEAFDRFRLWMGGIRRQGQAVAWVKRPNPAVLYHGNPLGPPYDRFDPLAFIPLYNLSTANTPSRPDRVLEFRSPSGDNVEHVELTDNGAGAVIQTYNGQDDRWLWTGTTPAQPLAWLRTGPDWSHMYQSYCHQDRRYVLVLEHEVSSTQRASTNYQYRYKIQIFDLPE